MKQLKSTKKENPYVRNRYVSFRLSEEELKQLEARAKLSGGNVGEYIRCAIFKFKPGKDDFEK